VLAIDTIEDMHRVFDGIPLDRALPLPHQPWIDASVDATYLIARGLFNRHASELAIGAIVAVISGGALLGGLLGRGRLRGRGACGARVEAVCPGRALDND
jgi:hypothetical protein